MYHLFVSGHVQDWQGEPWQIELGRCVREYTADAITKRYGGFTPAQVDELRRYPCIFAYEAVHSKNPLFGLIQNVTARQGQVRVEYELHPVDPFLSAEQLEQLTFELDIGKWEMNRTHWAVKALFWRRNFTATASLFLPGRAAGAVASTSRSTSSTWRF